MQDGAQCKFEASFSERAMACREHACTSVIGRQIDVARRALNYDASTPQDSILVGGDNVHDSSQGTAVPRSA